MGALMSNYFLIDTNQHQGLTYILV